MSWLSGQVFTDFRTSKKAASRLTLNVHNTTIHHYCSVMKKSKFKKQWKKPQIQVVQVCCECTAYVDVS
jgi:hypothetical protein